MIPSSALRAFPGIVFFAFIGFDAVSTLAEEVKNPQRDLPAGILGTLGIASALYVAVSLVVAGLVPTYGCGSNANAANGTNSSGRNVSDFSSLAAPWWGPANGSNSSGGGPGFGACPAGNGVPFCITTTAPLADAFTCLGLSVPATTVAVGAVTCLTATTLCSLFGQPRIFLAMANDGLLFPKFKTMTSKSQVPWFGTLVTGVVSSALGFVLNLDTLTNMISIGTLMAFTVVCMSVIVLRKRSDARPSQIYWLLAAWTAVSIAWGVAANATVCPPTGGVCTPQVYMPVFIPASCILAVIVVAMAMLPSNAVPGTYVCPLVPFLPALGVLTNIYLICGLDSASVYRIIAWTIVGMSIYFFYGMSHSTLETMQLPSSSETQRVPLLFGDAAGVASPPGVAIVQVQQHAGQPLALSATGRA
jgi:amino acid transporter